MGFGRGKEPCLVIALGIALLLSMTVTSLLVNLAKANPYLYHVEVSPPSDVKQPLMSINHAINNTAHASNSISLTLNVSIPETKATIDKYHLSIGIWYQLDRNYTFVPVYAYGGSGSSVTDFHGDVTISELCEGYHKIRFLARTNGGYADGLTWKYFYVKNYLTICFTVDTNSPDISVSPVENITSETSDVPLNFTVNEAVTEMSYSLDGQTNVTIAGNTTLTGLLVGMHNLTVYAWDAAGNVGASETSTFTIAEPEPFSTTIVIAPIASLAFVGSGLMVYFKKRKH